MPTVPRNVETAQRLQKELLTYVAEYVALSGTTDVFPTGHRIPFHWPPHPISFNFLLHESDWRGEDVLAVGEESFTIQVANTAHGIFGRVPEFWAEAKGATAEEMKANLATTLEPLFTRQRSIASVLGLPGRCANPLKEMSNLQLLKLLYCPDRDVANDAHTQLETRPDKVDFLPSLVAIIRDTQHEHRRSAQWCVLDMFEDLPSFCESLEDEIIAVDAIKHLMRTASDDYARTIYKAGVVLGGHLPDRSGAEGLLELLSAPSEYGRRSAIHGLFHVVEWDPAMRESVVAALRKSAAVEPNGKLREFATLMAHDIESESFDHIPEPTFDDERS